MGKGKAKEEREENKNTNQIVGTTFLKGFKKQD